MNDADVFAQLLPVQGPDAAPAEPTEVDITSQTLTLYEN
jgi:hypothetical protein